MNATDWGALSAHELLDAYTGHLRDLAVTAALSGPDRATEAAARAARDELLRRLAGRDSEPSLRLAALSDAALVGAHEAAARQVPETAETRRSEERRVGE